MDTKSEGLQDSMARDEWEQATRVLYNTIILSEAFLFIAAKPY